MRRGSIDWLHLQLDRIDHHQRGLREWTVAECGICGITPPDEFGNEDLIPDPRCPDHGVA